MISQKELAKLYSYLSNENQTFEQIIKSFNEEFDVDSRNKAFHTIIILLKDNLLNLSQRIISYFLLYNVPQKENMETNPFLFIILDKLKNSNNKKEQDFLIDFLYKKINYLKTTIRQYLAQDKREMRINLTQIKMQWDKYYKETLRKKNIKIKKDDINRPIIYDAKNVAIKNISNKPNNNILGHINNDKNNFNLNCYKANYMICFPVNNVFISNEPIWILPYLSHNYIWEKK